MHSVRRHELGVAVHGANRLLSKMHSVRRHELGAGVEGVPIYAQGCIPCGDMSWELK